MSHFWRLEDPVLAEDGTVQLGGMFEHQRKLWSSKKFIKALVTGYGGGKTLIGSKRAIAVALHNAPSPFLCVSPTYKMARRTLVPTIKNLLDGKQTVLPGLMYKFNKSEFEFTIRYGDREASIWVVSGEDPDSLKGPNIGAALIDEPFIQDRAVFDQVLARVRDPSAALKEIVMTGTPEDLNWGYDICEGEEKDNFDLDLIQVSSTNNKALSPEYYARLRRGLTDKAVQAYVDGQFVSMSEGLVYYAFSDEANVVDLPDPGHELLVGMDFNVDPMAAVVFWRNGNHMHVIKEIELPNADTEQMCSYLHELYPGRIRTVYPDASGKSRKTSASGRSDFYHLQQANFEVDAPQANPPIRDRYNAVNGKLKASTGGVSLTIAPSCKKLKTYFKSYSHRKLNKQQEMSHLLDALGYPTHRLWPIKPTTSYLMKVTGA